MRLIARSRGARAIAGAGPAAAAALLLLLGTAAAPPAPQQPAKPSGAAADKLVAEGRAFYAKSDYGAALLKFEDAVKQGAADGELFYQMGYCYKIVREDADTSKLYMSKAVPLLEQKLKEPSSHDLKTYYYLAAIRLNDVPDAAKLSEVSKEATEAVEAGRIPKPRDAEEFFQLGRLYGFSGKRDVAVANYEKAITALEKAGPPGKNAIYLHALQASGDMAVETKNWDKAADYYAKLLKNDSSRDDIRAPLALCYFRAKREMEAARIWQESNDPRMEDQKTYMTRVARHYVELDRPVVQAPASDEDLRKAIVDAGKEYAAMVTKDADAASAASAKWQEEHLAQRKASRGKKGGSAPPAEDLESIPPEKMTAEQRMRAMGYDTRDLEPPPPPPSPERLVAEKKFFGLLAELVRRGQYVQDFAVTNGLAPVIFK